MSLAEANVNRTATLAGTSIAIFTFLLFFLYPRFSSGEISSDLFQADLMIIGLAIFSFVLSGHYYYLLRVPWPETSDKPFGYLRRGDVFWFVGFSLLLVEPSLILFTVNLPVVASGWLGLWILYLLFYLREAARFWKRDVQGYALSGPK